MNALLVVLPQQAKDIWSSQVRYVGVGAMVVGGFGSLIFAQPLVNAHRAGTMVSVLRPASAPVVTDPPVVTTPETPTPTVPSPTAPPTVPMDELPRTGGGSGVAALLLIGLLSVLLGVILVAGRRRRPIRRWID